ncbi:LOW QUALITY PROTEIN: telomeric repeat binding factor a [Gymnodraco acuticeps]|uniref:LOW QUALITY PROTEIN: telomeric repeat binding factor a n=1 Tax=Gymnodraco acuticeps TaxID=8218 RepID=A0A6P8VCS1_GYMAC|nr:LOW QUALITY PROTEIN: telomeric repeat binding factor a [Gymnodraco acuticeps]
MAANIQADMEAFVNHWIVDYYSVLAIELFKTKKYEDFCGIVAILDGILTRPVYSSDVTPTKIRVLHFLARINEGEHLDVVFEQDPSVSPLESALKVLESMAKDCSTPLPERDFDHASASVKEMMVSLFIKNDEFDKAKEVLNKHFPKPRVGKKAIFTRLINKKSKTHEVIEHIDFQSFREEMFDYCQSLFSDVPFLLRAATRIIEEKRLRDQVAKAAGPDEQEAAGPSSAPQICSVHFTPGKHTILQRTRLEAAFKALSTCSDDKTFAQLAAEEEEEVEEEHQARNDLSLRLSPSPDPEQDVIFQGDSGSPMEASPTDQTDVVPKAQAEWLSKTSSVPRNKRLWTVARLVVEPDSQGSQSSSPASQEVEETEVRTEEPPQPPAAPDKSAELSVVTVDEDSLPVRKRRRRESNICSRKSEPLSSDSNEEPQESPAPCKAPVRKPLTKEARILLRRVPDEVHIRDSSLDSSPELYPTHPVPQKSSTPNKDSAREKGPAHSKWKVLYTNAKESRDTWSDEETYFSAKNNTGSKNQSVNQAPPGHAKMKWNEEETQMLIDGVKRFGEGNWSKIKSHFSFKERSNVSLKDRWRTMKNSKIV